MASPGERSIPDLLGEAVGQLSKLISNEFELARAEASDKMSKLLRSGAMVGAGAVFMIPAFVILLMAAAEGLIAAGMSHALAFLTISIVAVAIAGGLIMFGISRLTADAMMPKATIDQLQRDKQAAKEMVK